MGFFIECTIAEIEIKNNEYILKIRGIDGYVLSKNSRTYNVFFPEDLGKLAVLPTNPSAIVLDAESLIVLKAQHNHCFPLCHSFCSKVRIKFKTCVYRTKRGMYELIDE